MTFKNNLYKICLLGLSSLGTVNCEKISQGDKAPADKITHNTQKWEEFRQALKLPADSPYQSEFFKAENAKEYQVLVGEAASRLTRHTWATRCAAIESITPHSEPEAMDFSGNKLKAKVYVMKYRLQKNKAGDPGSDVRSGIVTIPDFERGDGKVFPILAFAHGDDRGLSYEQIRAGVGKLQEDYLVIAPTYPGEPLTDMNISAVGESIPWENDVDELLGMHNCLTHYFQYKVAKNLWAGAEKDNPVKLFPVIDAKVLDEIIDFANEDVHLAFYHNYVSFTPKSIVTGVSRGGLVASLALAKSGAMLMALKQKDPELLKKFLNRNAPWELMDELSMALNSDKFGPGVPMFAGAATVSSPASVTVGEFRYVLEQIVKGHGHRTVAKDRPGIRKLLHIFDDFRNGLESVDEVKFKIILRDMLFLNPLISAALKDWDNPLMPGSLLLMHGSNDRVVPDSQTQAAANLMLAASEDPTSKNETLSPLGMNIWVRIFEKNKDQSVCKPKDSFHVNQCFYNSHAVLPKNFFTLQASADFLRPKIARNSLFYAYSLYGIMQSIPDVEIYEEMVKEMSPVIDKEAWPAWVQIFSDLDDQERKNGKIKARLFRQFLAEHGAKIQKSMTNLRKNQIKEAGQKILKSEDPFTDEDLNALFALNLADKKELIKFYKTHRNIQFAVESMLANGNTLKFSDQRLKEVIVEPLTKWEHMSFRKGPEGGLRQTESQTPAQILESWASRFTAQTPAL